MDYNKISEIVKKLKGNEICLEDIEKELDYRDNSHYNWNDDLCEYSTEELGDVEQIWYEV